jgi:type IV pilus assembly protein PilO
MKLDLNELQNLDPNNIGNWPLPVRIALIISAGVGLFALGYYFDTMAQQEQYQRVVNEESKLRKEFSEKQGKAVNLPAFQQQMREMEESFGTMLRQLPSRTEVAELLVDVTQTGLAAGLEFDLFQPSSEVPRDFYAELPITMSVTGSYHAFGEFVSGVAALPRIVTLHDMVISGDGNPNRLRMQLTARTYRYLDPEEIAAHGGRR